MRGAHTLTSLWIISKKNMRTCHVRLTRVEHLRPALGSCSAIRKRYLWGGDEYNYNLVFATPASCFTSIRIQIVSDVSSFCVKSALDVHTEFSLNTSNWKVAIHIVTRREFRGSSLP